MSFLKEACEISAVLKIIYFIQELLKIVCFIVPILLIVMLMVDFFKNVIAGREDETNKNLNIAIKRTIMCVGLFLVPTIVNFMVMLLGDLGVPYVQCLKDANLENIAQLEAQEEAERLAQEEAEKDAEKQLTNLKNGNGMIIADGGSSSYKMYTSDKIKLNETLIYLKYENTYQLKVSGDYDSSQTISWSSSNSNVASVDANGVVTSNGGGVAVITAKVGGEATSCKVIGIRVNLTKAKNGNWIDGKYVATATVYYDGNKKLNYYFRKQSVGDGSTACEAEKLNGKNICTSGFKTWYVNHGCVTTAVTAIVNAYQGRPKSDLISAVKMRMYYEKKEYNWKCDSSDPYCNKKLFQLTRTRVEGIFNNQFNLSATAYTLKTDKSDQQEHIDRITNALAEGRPIVFFVHKSQAGNTKYTSQVHGLAMVGFYDEKGNVLVMDSNHSGIASDTVEQLVKKYIKRGTGNYSGYIVLNNVKG